MRRLVDVMIVLAIVGAAVFYGPSIIDSLREDASFEPEQASGQSVPGQGAPGRDRNSRDAERTREDMSRRAFDAQADAIEDQIDQLKEAERNCYAAARRPGGTDATCRMYADRIRAAEERLRSLKRQ